ncbi:Calcium homeostasis endoplasmic reticulum protein [Ophiocordyceps camponoti-floridani]|uniref:Calcium homeostasis endoplasmic reticulum protein n=1 Tax=Ophiocordyceps camponoti-floridani TaxID=2030778 RepID=A0A8H4Q8D0_9HYPO|nr:Calcium homeostasis endoplasmic reticulum protein [Ophiocordyceps camponoti-floridani]
MVVTPDLAAAKANLTALLLRADPESLSRAAAAEFLELLDNTLDKCSRPNVQKCKNWILANVVPSDERAFALGRYLVALSESMEKDFDRPSVRRRRLHVLYIASDVLHHAVICRDDQHLSRAWEGHLPAMIATASTFEKYPKHLRKVRALIDLWEEKRYLYADVILKLRDSFTRASDKESGTRIQMSSAALELAKEAPFLIPSVHGEASVPWNDLPAATWLPQLKPGSTQLMSRNLVRPVQLKSGVAPQPLVQVVKDTLQEAKTLYVKDHLRDRTSIDFNLMGETQAQPGTRETATYWGWTPKLCRRVKQGQHCVETLPQNMGPSRSPFKIHIPIRDKPQPHPTPKPKPQPQPPSAPDRPQHRQQLQTTKPSPSRAQKSLV